MKVALVLCPSWDWCYPIYSQALLAAILKRRGTETSIYDLNRVLVTLNEAPAAEKPEMVAAPYFNFDWLHEDFIHRQMQAYRGYLDSVVKKILSDGNRVVGFSVYIVAPHQASRPRRRGRLGRPRVSLF